LFFTYLWQGWFWNFLCILPGWFRRIAQPTGLSLWRTLWRTLQSCCTEAVKEFIAVAQFFFFANVLVDLVHVDLCHLVSTLI
jgi:hypothetical protein